MSFSFEVLACRVVKTPAENEDTNCLFCDRNKHLHHLKLLDLFCSFLNT